MAPPWLPAAIVGELAVELLPPRPRWLTALSETHPPTPARIGAAVAYARQNAGGAE